MKRLKKTMCISLPLVLLICVQVIASEVTVPHNFNSGTPAVAEEVNANFNAVKTAVDDNDGRIESLAASIVALQSRVEALDARVADQISTIAVLQSRLDDVETSGVMALSPYILVDEITDERGPLVRLSGVNLQLVNGEGYTDSVNGLGNLIIGYDEVDTDAPASDAKCSDGLYVEQEGCEGAGEVWSTSHKSGSHYLVTGLSNNYSQYGGIVAGSFNFANGAFSTVTGGYQNVASGEVSSVSGGRENVADGEASSVSGGVRNVAYGENSSVSSGFNNSASSYASSVSGGSSNEAAGFGFTSVSGGYNRRVTDQSEW
jgi:hypothetical protein